MDNASVAPTVVPLDLLQEITNGFSEERKLGSGSFGKVYKGMHHDGKKIAVKMLYDMPGLDNEQFQNELKNLSRLRHKNIVRLVGYCHDIKEVQIKYEGKLVIAEKIHRALCLEYMSNGSLDKYLSDECDRYDWQTGYGIIKGICHGLKYLHNELKPPIYHLDLKPANVLLDENMVPRIADFGMSRLFRDEQTRATKSSLGTIGYLPPEYIKKSLISSKFDIFSLGVVIIKIMAGRAGYFNSAEVSSQEFINLVQKNWTKRLVETLNRKNAYSEQVKICIEIGLSCVQEDRHKRPAIEEIVRRLEETETRCAYAARKDWLLVFQGEKRTATEEPSDSGPTTPLPDKKLLVFILDRLQKKDTYGVFSEPVDDEELPDYKDIVKHPMDFSTVRKKLDKGAYGNLEQFEDDLFLITSNAMCYNSSDTVYYEQARAIQEVAKKDFENLRQDSDASEPETEPLPEQEPKPQRRRGRPPKNAVQPKVERPPAERATADFSRATLTTAANSGIHAHSGYDIQQRIADVLKASFANRSSEHNWASGHKLGSIEDYSGSGSKWSGKMGKNPLPVEESRRTTYYQHQQSSSMYELPSSYNGTRKLLVPIGVHLQQSYPNSLARFAAQLGPVGWEIASKRTELAIPPGMTFGRGWVGTEESPNTFQPPVPTSSSAAVTTTSSTAASSDQHTVDDPASASHSAGPHPRIDSQAVPSMQCGSVPQVSVDRDEQAVEMRSSHNVHEWPAKHQTVNGFNAVPGSVMFAPPAQLVASRMPTHTAD